MNQPTAPSSGRDLWKLAVLALGVVFGDIGTSPLYTLKECLHVATATTGSFDRTQIS